LKFIGHTGKALDKLGADGIDLRCTEVNARGGKLVSEKGRKSHSLLVIQNGVFPIDNVSKKKEVSLHRGDIDS
jgi:hypothetical protein